VSGGGVGTEDMVTKGANQRGPGTKTKRSQIVFTITSIALILERLGTQLLGLPVQSLIESPSTLAESWYPLSREDFGRMPFPSLGTHIYLK